MESKPDEVSDDESISFTSKQKLIFAYDFKYELHTNVLEFDISSSRALALAKKGKVDFIILNKGLAKKYIDDIREANIGLILNYNAKSPYLSDIQDIATIEDVEYFKPHYVLFHTLISDDFSNLENFNELFSSLHDSDTLICGNVIISTKRNQFNTTTLDDLIYSVNAAHELGYDAFILSDALSTDELEQILLASEIEVWLSIRNINDIETLLHTVKEYRDLGITGLILGNQFLSVFDSPKILNSVKKIFVEKKNIEQALKEVQTT
ncbi:MAG: hypothetical protein N3E37_02205 [Candidatus Micrarchaeota archaeon]|nr:hypothetical protein [Candidatus Micrarchaeota archaeon]